MKKLLLLLFTILSNSLSAQTTSRGDEIIGVWLSEEKDGKIEIYKQGNRYFGKLIWGKEMYEADGITSKKDVNNTDEKLQKRNLKDLILLTDFVFEGDSWSGGKIYDPKSGKTYSCNMKLNGTVLDIRGYVGISLFGRTSQWTRVK